jgi:hypothetical protein
MRWLWAILAVVIVASVGWWWWGRTRPLVDDESAATKPMVPAVTPASPSPSPHAVVPPPARDATSHTLVRTSWGGGAGQLGRKNDPEGAPDGPMSLTVDGRGTVWVLDEVNRRIQRWSNRGAPLAPISIGTDTAQDLALGRNGSVALLDRLGEKNLLVLSSDGAPVGEVRLEGKGIPEAGGTTGLFTDKDGNFWVEREHRDLVRVALPDGHSDAERQTAPGRPSRDGRQYLSGAIADRAAGTALLRGLDADGHVLWEQLVALGAPLLYLNVLDSDGAGNVYLGGHTGRQGAQPPYGIVDENLVIVGLSPSGSPRGILTLAASPPAAESFHEVTIGDDGTIYRMVLGAGGVVIETYHL